jgi:hypothetical protein
VLGSSTALDVTMTPSKSRTKVRTGHVLSLKDDILELDPAQWKTTWRKGGVGPGVLTLAHLATSPTGQSYVVTVFAETGPSPSTLSRQAQSSSRRSRGRSRWRRAAEIRD